MSKRSLPRIDYNIFNSTGQCVEKIATSEDLSNQFNQLSLTEMPSQSTINIKVLIQEVEDTIDENPINPGADLQEIIQKLSDIRKSIRENE